MPGVDYVTALSAMYDGSAPSPPGQPPPMTWRTERTTARRLTACPTTVTDDTQVQMFADECVFVDSTTLNVSVE